MATSAWFNYNVYMNNKLAQLQKDDSAAGWNMAKLVEAFAAADFVGDTGAEQHFLQYGQDEDVAPNAFFNPTEYFRAKAAQYYGKADPKTVTDLEVANMQVAIKNAGMSAWSHYEMYGTAENVNPSNSFNTEAYMAAKLTAMQVGDATYTMDKLQAAFKAAGFSALEHFMLYGGKGDGEVTQGLTTDGKIPTAFEVPENQKVNSGGGGETFPLTTGIDNIVGTAGNDTINGGLFAATGATIQAFDVIDGGAGIDTLNITATDNGDVLGGALVKNVENINVRTASGSAAILDASGAIGLTNVNANLGAGTLVVKNLAKDAAVTITGDGTVVNGAVAIGYATATDAVTLNLAGGTKVTATITVDGTLSAAASGTATSATINSNGAANSVGTVDLANATLTSVTFNAATDLKGDFLSQATDQVGTDGAVTIKGAATSVEFTAALDNTITTIDASGLTAGGLTATLGTGIKTFMGGQGNDVITAAATTTVGAVIDAGAGTADKLILEATNDVSSAAKGAQYKNFEILNLADSQDVSLIAGITSIELNAMTSKSITKLSAAQAAAITVLGNQTSGLTLSLADDKGTADVVSLTLGDGKGAAFDTGALTVNGFETLNLKANAMAGNGDQTSSIASFAADKLTAINLTGSAFTLTNAATVKAATIDASALTGTGGANSTGLTLGGALVAGSKVIGSAVNDAFTIGAEGSTYSGGAGNDTFSTTAALLVADGTTDLVLDGGAGIDTLTVAGGATLTDNHFTNVTGFEKLMLDGVAAVSLTGAGAAFKAAFADGVTITSGTLDDNASYTVGLGLYDKAVDLTLVSSGAGNDSADNITIVTGSGADKVSVTAKSWLGAVSSTGIISVKTGAGDDTISVETGTLVAAAGTAPVIIDGGAGKDTINLVGVNAVSGLMPTIKIAAGESTLTAYDTITGFDMADGSATSSRLAFDSVALNAYTATAAAGNSAAELTVAVSSTGKVTFAGSKVAGLTLADMINAVASVVTNGQGDSALFTHGGNSYVFNNDTAGDSVVELIGVAGVQLVTGVTTVAGDIHLV